VRKGKRNGFFDYAQNDGDTLRMTGAGLKMAGMVSITGVILTDGICAC